MIDKIADIFSYICGMPVLYLACLCAIVLLVYSKGFVFVKFKTIIQYIFGKGLQKNKTKEGISLFSACCSALGNTLGVGNIAGIAIAVSMGGPGALFWIWVTGLLAMVIKFSEVILGAKYRVLDPDTGMYRGGIMWYIEIGLGKKKKWMAVLYALLYGVIGSWVVSSVQINSVVSAFDGTFHFPPIILGIVIAIALAFVLIGGARVLSDIAEKIVPFMALVYFAVSMAVLVVNISEIPGVFRMVVTSAFTETAAEGGFAGATAAMAIRYGIMRGFYSNGAATGDAAFMYSIATSSHPVEQGMMSVLEVLVDVLTCTCTGFVILSTGVLKSGLNGAALTAEAFATLFGSHYAGGMFVGIIITIFAFTTVIVSTYYSENCIVYLWGNSKYKKYVIYIFRTLQCMVAVVGSVANLEVLWNFSDISLALCMFITLSALILSRNNVKKLTMEYLTIHSKK